VNVDISRINMLLKRVICNNVCSKIYTLVVCPNAHKVKRSFSSTDGDIELLYKVSTNTEKDEKKRSGFARAFERSTSTPEIRTQPPEKEDTFASLLRNSKLIDVIILYDGKMYTCNSNVSGTCRQYLFHYW
jgi:hypothetical protein